MITLNPYLFEVNIEKLCVLNLNIMRINVLEKVLLKVLISVRIIKEQQFSLFALNFRAC